MASKRFYLHAEYNESLACYENFYREKMCYNVTIGSQTKEMCADGANDLSENISDVKGTRVAFEALKHKLGDNGKLKLRPLPDHFEFTNEQIFFIARSQFWCDNDFLDDEYFVKVLKSSGPHPPHNVRVNAVPMQMHEFAEAFNCKLMDKMVTVEAEKCYLLPSGQ
uniref:Peptidase M13 C-terminal domain-containing protein n=1 Tax=Plectus sambesii TaxID=2011161 RepID=A0A914WE59_9BILA